MTNLAPFLAGLIAGMIVGSFVLHWLLGVAHVIGPRSNKLDGRTVREALIVTIANSGFWILVVATYVGYEIFAGPLDKPRILGTAGLVSAIGLLGVIAYGFGRGPGSLVMRFAQSMRRKENFMRFGVGVGSIVTAPMLYEWYEMGLSAGFLAFAAVLWAAAIYFMLWYMWQFVPWDKPPMARNKKG